MLTSRLCIVIGCGRSGTKLMSRIFQEAGLDIPHESTGKDGSVNWFRTANPRFYLRSRYGNILHQVRHPLACMSSCQTILEKSWLKIQRSVPIQSQDDLILRCAKYWYYWNVMADKKADYRYQIEQVQEHLPEIWEVIGARPPQEFDWGILQAKVNSRKNQYQSIKWEDIWDRDRSLHQKCIRLARAYGYTELP